MTGNALRRVFRFGVFEADEASAELRKHGVRVKLNTQPFQVLVMLVERPSELVTREEMRQRLWGTDTFVDFDHSLNSAVNKIRTVLGDSSATPRYIETVAGKGYRFIAPVSQVQPAAVPETAVAPGAGSLLSTPEELPAAPRRVAATLIVLVQALYLGIYLVALANLHEVSDVLRETAARPHQVFLTAVIGTAAALIPVRLYLIAGAWLGLRQLSQKFARMFPVLFLVDELWALSPFLLVHHIAVGLALAMSATLVYLPFAQRSLVLMYQKGK